MRNMRKAPVVCRHSEELLVDTPRPNLVFRIPVDYPVRKLSLAMKPHLGFLNTRSVFVECRIRRDAVV